MWHITLSLSPWHNIYCGIYGILYYMAYMAYNIIWHIILYGIGGIYGILLSLSLHGTINIAAYMAYYIIWHTWHIILYGILYYVAYMPYMAYYSYIIWHIILYGIYGIYVI